MARKLFDSELWTNKPSSWLKIWIYIIGKVNHTKKGKFERGTNFFNFRSERSMIGPDISDDTIKKFLRFARRSLMVSTTRSTRGCFITVLNYNDYQQIASYSGTTESTKQAPQKHHRSTPINKNDKNERMKEGEGVPPPTTTKVVSSCQNESSKYKNCHDEKCSVISNMKSLYYNATGNTFHVSKRHHIIIKSLISEHGEDKVIEKINALAFLCSRGQMFPAKSGWADFTVINIYNHWNSIILHEKRSAEDVKVSNIVRNINNRMMEEDNGCRVLEYESAV